MTISRRELLQAGRALGVIAVATSAQSNPVLGLVAPPANYPVPPEGLALYDRNLRFLVHGLGLKTMTPAGYDSVIDKIVPATRQQANDGANAIANGE
jgi:hypothetical protein